MVVPGATVYTRSGQQWPNWWWLTDLGTGREFRIHESEIFSKAPEYGGLFEEEKSNGQ